MNRLTTAALCGSLVFCGAPVLAAASSTGGAVPGNSTTTSLKQKLMRECMSHEGPSNTEAKGACNSQVESELMDMKNAGTRPGQQKPEQ